MYQYTIALNLYNIIGEQCCTAGNMIPFRRLSSPVIL